MKLVPLSDIFDVKYGTSLELNALVQTESGINFVSRTENNNGVSAKVKQIAGVTTIPAGTISVALGGSVLESFLQPADYYSGRDIACLYPKVSLSDQVKLFYASCIRKNKYRYSYGRQANRSLKSIMVPAISEIPSWVHALNMAVYSDSVAKSKSIRSINLSTESWHPYRYDEIFDIKKGYYNKKPPFNTSHGIPFIGATESNNGITCYIEMVNLVKYSRGGEIIPTEKLERKLFPGGCITVSNDGSVGEAFFQDAEFTCSHSVNPLYLKDNTVVMTPGIALFLCTLIRLEKYRWGFGRKWRPIRMPSSIIFLPSKPSPTDTSKMIPDWDFMESYINATKFSSQI
jgi:hypothetical protein